MSYEIVYNRQFLKVDDKIIPLTLYGSNNCYEYNHITGKERRERGWHPMYLGRNTLPALPADKLMEHIRTMCNGYEHFMKNGKWVDDAGLIRFFEKGIKEAMTIEEMKEEYFFSGLHGHFSIWGGMNNTIENRMEISSTDKLREFLTLAQERLDNRAEKEEIYICIEYYSEEFKSKNPAVRYKTPKERLSDFYAIKVRGGYIMQVTSRRVRYASLCNKTKQFKTEKEANKYIQKLQEKFYGETFEVEHITVEKESGLCG